MLLELLESLNRWIGPMAGLVSGLLGLAVAVGAYVKGRREEARLRKREEAQEQVFRQREQELQTLQQTVSQNEMAVAGIVKTMEGIEKQSENLVKQSELLAALKQAFETPVESLEKKLREEMKIQFALHQNAMTRMIEQVLGRIHLADKDRTDTALIMLRSQLDSLDAQLRVAEVQRATILRGMSELEAGASASSVREQLRAQLDAELAKSTGDPMAAAAVRMGIGQLETLLSPVLEPFLSVFANMFGMEGDPREKQRQELQEKLREQRTELDSSIAQLKAQRNELSAKISGMENSPRR